MDPRTAKGMADAKGFALYYDTQLRLWTCSTKDLRPVDLDGNTARHIAPQQLRSLTRQQFEEFYLCAQKNYLGENFNHE